MVQHDFFTAATVTVSYMERYKPVRQRLKTKICADPEHTSTNACTKNWEIPAITI